MLTVDELLALRRQTLADRAALPHLFKGRAMKAPRDQLRRHYASQLKVIAAALARLNASPADAAGKGGKQRS